MKADEMAVCAHFGERDPGYVSRPRLYAGINNLMKDIDMLELLLFAENPNHAYFNGFSKERKGKLYLDSRKVDTSLL